MLNGQKFNGDFPEIINNTNNVYEGNLRHYFAVVLNAPNVHNGYHGLRHMLHVTWVSYHACRYYVALGKLTQRRARSLLIGSKGHDLKHPGYLRDDRLNIQDAKDFLRLHILPEDEPYLPEIFSIMDASLYPHVDYGGKITLEQAIIRDADVSQSLGPVWMGDILGGLGKELGKTPIQMLELQEGFLREIRFYSAFGEKYFGQRAIDAKIKEVRSLLQALK